MKKINYLTLKNLFDHPIRIGANGEEMSAWDTACGLDALCIESTTMPAEVEKYHDPKEHLKNFLNSYLVETAFQKAYEHMGVRFLEEDRHMNLYEGMGTKNCDLYCGDCKIEVKNFVNQEAFDRWLNKQQGTFDKSHNCNVYFIYVRTTKRSWVYYPDDDVLEKARYQIKVRLYN